VRWAFRARRDFIHIADYFASRAPDYPPRLVDRIDEVAQLLAERPELGAHVSGTPYRKFRVHGTVYILLYKAARRELIVARVHHAKEDWRPL
jgi:plasmid stabilization system protein ParE